MIKLSIINGYQWCAVATVQRVLEAGLCLNIAASTVSRRFPQRSRWFSFARISPLVVGSKSRGPASVTAPRCKAGSTSLSLSLSGMAPWCRLPHAMSQNALGGISFWWFPVKNIEIMKSICRSSGFSESSSFAVQWAFSTASLRTCSDADATLVERNTYLFWKQLETASNSVSQLLMNAKLI